MTIESNTPMLLFRFSNFGKYKFIDEHINIIRENGYVWMLKMGRKSNIDKLKLIKKAGGWIILREPKADGAKSYLAHFSEIVENQPIEKKYPNYYLEIIDNPGNFITTSSTSYQWFRIDMIKEMKGDEADSLVITKTEKKVNEAIGTTRTAVMFIKNNKAISV